MERYRRFGIGILIAFWLVFFWRQIAGGEVWYCCDNLLVNIPSKVFLVTELRQGRFPLNNPYIFSGTPFFADINLAVLHPLNLLYFVFPPFRALTMGILLLFLVGSTGMYYLGRSLRLGVFASLFGAVVFGFSGSLVVYANNIPILQVAVLLPWVMAMWLEGRFILFILVAAFQVFSGHPQLTYYTWLLLLTHVLVQKTGFRHLVKSALLVTLVSSIQVIPFFKFMMESTRLNGDYMRATMGSIHPLSLVRLVIPGIVGDLPRGTAWIQAGSIHGYVGFLPLLLLPLALSTRIGRFFIAVAIISLLMALGKYTPVFWLAFHFIPGIALLREPAQTLFFWGFGIAGAAMVAVETLVKKPQSARYVSLIGVIFLLGAGTLVTLHLDIIKTMASLVTSKAFPPGLIQDIIYNLSLFGVIGIVGGIIIGVLRVRIAKMILLGLLFADLFIYGQTNVTTIPEATVKGWQEETRTRIISWKLLDTKNYRYYTDPVIYPYPYKKTFGQFNDPGESAWQLKILRPTLGMLYGLSAVDGYASMVKSSYQQWFGVPARDPTGVVIPSIVDPRLQEAGVRYIITKPNNPLLADTKRYRQLAVDGEIAIYEDNKAVPIRSLEEIE